MTRHRCVSVFSVYRLHNLQLFFFQTITIFSISNVASSWSRTCDKSWESNYSDKERRRSNMKSLCIKSWTGFLKKSPVVARIASDGDTNRIYRDEFTFSRSRNPAGQPRRRRERHKGWAMMNWMQLASPWRSPGGFVTRPDVRARPHTTPTYIRDICSYAISWVRGYLTIRPVFAPGNDSPSSHTHTRIHVYHAATR